MELAGTGYKIIPVGVLEDSRGKMNNIYKPMEKFSGEMKAIPRNDGNSESDVQAVFISMHLVTELQSTWNEHQQKSICVGEQRNI